MRYFFFVKIVQSCDNTRSVDKYVTTYMTSLPACIFRGNPTCAVSHFCVCFKKRIFLILPPISLHTTPLINCQPSRIRLIINLCNSCDERSQGLTDLLARAADMWER